MNNIKVLRIAAGLTQQNLADQLGITQQAVARWEAGKTMPRAEQLATLASVLNCTIDAILVRTGQDSA